MNTPENQKQKQADRESLQETARDSFWDRKCAKEPGCIGCKIYDI